MLRQTTPALNTRVRLARALARLAWRIAGRPPQVERSWKAARKSVLLARWAGLVRPVDAELRFELEVLRARSREEAQNNDHVRHFLRLAKQNIVGPLGVRLQSRARLRNGRPDQRAIDAIEEAWREWGRRGSCEVSSRLSWRDLQCQVVETVARDGEAIVRRVNGWRGNDYQVALQAIDPERLDITINEERAGRRVVLGVELDDFDAPVAYHLLPAPATPNEPASARRGRSTRVPADQIYHVYLPEWVTQTRGVPWTATALERLHHLGEYEDAEVIGARGASAKMGFYERDPEATGAFPGDGEDDTGAPVEDVRPGEIPILPPGWTFKGWDPQHPGAQFGDFTKSMLRSIASGLGVNYNTLANDLEGVNFTSLRHGALTERDVWMMLQGWLVEWFIEPVYRDWLRSALLAGAIKGPNGAPLLAERIDEFRRVSWQPRRWRWVDPLKEVQANRAEWELRARSVSDIIREQGRDPDEVWEEIARDEARMRDLGVEPPMIQQAPAPAAPPAEEAENAPATPTE